jgi:hypothetical protein
VKGPRRKISIREIAALLSLTLVEQSTIGLGLDLATTEKETSNPSALSVVEGVGRDLFVRLLLRWKTSDPEVTMAIIMAVLMAISPRKARKLCVDATSEKFFAATVRRRLSGIVPVDLIVASESTEYLGEKMLMKVYLNNLLINYLEDGLLHLADEPWIKDDFRLVKRSKGTFIADVDANGGHADGFDAVKLGCHAALGKGGPARAEAAQVGGFGRASSAIWKNPLAYLHERGGRTNV